jgi:alpha-beta hydrolase superfamily lysophospholipase
MVHGAFTGGWIWEPLAKELRAAGHTVDTFDLPGLGEDQTAPADVTLDLCARRLIEVLASNPEPAIVAGNSMGGGSSPRRPQHWRLRALPLSST